LLCHTFEAITGWTGLAAGVTADAAVKFLHPKGQSLPGRHPLQFHHVNIVLPADCLGYPAHYEVVDERHALRTALAACLRLAVDLHSLAGQTYHVDPFPLYLFFVEEHVQGAGIAGFDQDAHAGRDLPNAPGTGAESRLELVQVGDQVIGTTLIPDQAVGLAGFVHERWPHPAPGPLLVADETVYLAALQ
jgi:hypothetical protein